MSDYQYQPAHRIAFVPAIGDPIALQNLNFGNNSEWKKHRINFTPEVNREVDDHIKAIVCGVGEMYGITFDKLKILFNESQPNCYQPSNHSITLSSMDFDVIAHELGHAVLWTKGFKFRNDKLYDYQISLFHECFADLTAVLCSWYMYDTIGSQIQKAMTRKDANEIAAQYAKLTEFAKTYREGIRQDGFDQPKFATFHDSSYRFTVNFLENVWIEVTNIIAASPYEVVNLKYKIKSIAERLLSILCQSDDFVETAKRLNFETDENYRKHIGTIERELKNEPIKQELKNEPIKQQSSMYVFGAVGAVVAVVGLVMLFRRGNR